MSKKLTVVLLTSLATAAASYVAGDEFVCANAEEKQRLIDAGLAAADAKTAEQLHGSVSIKNDVAQENARLAAAQAQADLLNDENPDTGA